jgi:hypothetical protein
LPVEAEDDPEPDTLADIECRVAGNQKPLAVALDNKEPSIIKKWVISDDIWRVAFPCDR